MLKKKEYTIWGMISLVSGCTPVDVCLYDFFSLVVAFLPMVSIYAATAFIDSALTLATAEKEIYTFIISIALLFLFYALSRLSNCDGHSVLESASAVF